MSGQVEHPGRPLPRVIDERADAPLPGLGYVEAAPYDREQRLDDVRARLAFLLAALLVLVILSVFVLVLTDRWTRIPISDIQRIAEMVVTPVVALFSAAAGFYFGAQVAGPLRPPPRHLDAAAAPAVGATHGGVPVGGVPVGGMPVGPPAGELTPAD